VAGLKAGDVITQVNGRDIDNPGDVRRELDDVEDGGVAALTVVRDKKELALKVKVDGVERSQRRRRDI
jgi:serine protease Do